MLHFAIMNVTANTQDKYRLRIVFWETTTACNLSCRHCRRQDTAPESALQDLTTKESLNLIEDVKQAGRPLLILSGGEPLLRKDLFTLVDYARERDIPLALATNGTCIDKSIAVRIRDSGIRRVSVSLDGADARIHDQFRGIPGAFERAIQGIRLLIQQGISTQINFTLARHNAGQMEQMFTLASALHVDALHLFLLVPVGCGLEIAPAEMLTSTEYEKLLRRFHILSRDYRSSFETRATCAPHYYRIISQMREDNPGSADDTHNITSTHPHHGSRGCLAGINVCFISHRGEVFPCGYLPVSSGNIRTRSLAEIWNESTIFKQLRDYSLLKGKCGKCRFVDVCGGCRARAFAYSGDYLAEEPYCIYTPS